MRNVKACTVCLIALLAILVAVTAFSREGYIFGHEVESYDAVFEIIDTDITIGYKGHLGITAHHILSIRNVNNPNESYNVDVSLLAYYQCGIGRLATFNVKIVETIFGKTAAIVTFQSVK